MKNKIILVFGTRPEAIKLASVIHELRARPECFEVTICVTGQHRKMLDQILDVFHIKPDMDLDIMMENQSLSYLTTSIIEKMHKVFQETRYDWAIVQGDTTTSTAAALCAFYNNTKVAHVEAGLRTDNKQHPFPEEINRRLTSQIADLHFAPTENAKTNLLREGIHPDHIFVTGNTVIDALMMAVSKVDSNKNSEGIPPEVLYTDKIVLITGHRRENFGEGFQSICNSIIALAHKFTDTAFVYPVHLNPNVRKTVFGILKDVPNIHLIEPLSYLPFVALMKRSSIILTDSGGIQEEAPSLGKPVLVMREKTERPEAIAAGTAKMVGTNKDRIVEEVSRLLNDKHVYTSMSQIRNPYGDGTSARKIVDILDKTIQEK